MKANVFALLSMIMTSFNCLAIECENWQELNPEWIWCDDFENDDLLNKDYFEVNRANKEFGVTQDFSFDGNGALKATYLPGISESGNIKFSFGKTPVAPTRYTNQIFNEIYWRFYVKLESGWQGNPHKLTRATIFSASDWSQAAIAHIWENSSLGVGLDPVSGVVGNSIVTKGYNDFDNFTWLGGASGKVEIYAQENDDKWHCIEAHMALNTPYQSDGIFEFWINNDLQASRSDLNWRGGYTDYGINAIILENYVSGGMPRKQSRYMDNFVVSRERINCKDTTTKEISPPLPPSNVTQINSGGYSMVTVITGT